MRTKKLLRSCRHGFVGRLPAYLLGAFFAAGLALSIPTFTYAVHDVQVFELDNGIKGANAIDESETNNPDAFRPDDWGQNNYDAATGLSNLGNCPEGVASCGYVAGPNVEPGNPGGHAFRSLFIADPSGAGNNDDVFTGGGSKDHLDVSQWAWTTSSAPDKDDLLPIGAAAYMHPDTNDLLIYMFGSLFAPNGSAAIGAWLFKKNIGTCADGTFGVVDNDGNCLANQPAELHELGDVFVVAETKLGGRQVHMKVYQWVGSDAAAQAQCLAAGNSLENNSSKSLCKVLDKEEAFCSSGVVGDDACGSMNLGEIKDKGTTIPGYPTESPDDWGFLSKFPPANGPAEPAGTNGIQSDDFPETSFFEAGFNFSKLFPNSQGCFNSFLMNTRASHEVSAVLKDVALGKFPLCGVEVTKGGDEDSKIGDEATYSFTIKNIGAIALTRESVIDNKLGDLTAESGADCAVLQPGAECKFEKKAPVPADAEDPHVNTVTVVYSAGEDQESSTDSHSLNLFQPSITFDKSGDTELSKVGDVVNYTLTLNNTSSEDTPDLECSITDAKLGINENVTLASGGEKVINHAYTVQEGDADPLVNTAEVLCSPIGFPNEYPADDSHTVNLFQPSIELSKTGDALSKVGDEVNYSITLKNTSSDDSPDLECTISDPMLGVDEQVTLGFEGEKVINKAYTVLEVDDDPLPNTATASCSPVGFENVLPDSASHEVNLFQPSVTVDKTANCDVVGVTAGADITYSYLITNTSSDDSPNLQLASVVDDKLGSLTAAATANGCESLAWGATCSFDVVYTTTAADVGTITNTVDVLYNPSGFPNEIRDDDTQDCLVVAPNPATVVIEKLLLNGEGLAFNYSATGLPVLGFSLTPLFAGAPLGNSPFAAPGVGEGFATTIEFTVDIATIADTELVSVTEELPLPAFVDFVSLECAAATGGTLNNASVVDMTANLTLGSGDFAFCRYVNQLTPPGDDGCTPGYWKVPQHHDSWPSPYTTSTVLNTVFTFPVGNGNSPKAQVASLQNDTMLQALNYGGGSSAKEAAQILLRAAVAAVLNAAHPDVDFSFTLGQVIADVNAALDSANRDTMLALATTLDKANNGVLEDNSNTESCPLN